MLIIPSINKFACLLTITTRNSRTARNVLWLLPLLLLRTCTFPLPSSVIPRVFPFPPCLFLRPYFPSWHLRFDAGSLSDLPTAMYIYRNGGSFTLQFGYFVRINIWRHSGSRTYTPRPSVSDTITVVHRHLTGQARRWCRQLDEFPGTLYFTIFTFYRSSSWTPAI